VLRGSFDFWGSGVRIGSDAVEGDLHAVLSVFEGSALDGDRGSFDFGMDKRFSDLRKSDIARGGVGKGSNHLLIDLDCDLGCHDGILSGRLCSAKPFIYLWVENHKTGIAAGESFAEGSPGWSPCG
jgi:hypothetical protein